MVDHRKPLLEFERAVSTTHVFDAQIAHDGTQVGYVTTPASQDGPHPLRTLWLVATSGGAPQRLSTSEVADWSPRWSPDGRFLAFLSDRQQRGTAQLYLLALPDGQAMPLTEQPAGVQAL